MIDSKNKYILLTLVLLLVLIIILSISFKETFYNPPSSQLFKFGPLDKRSKYNNHDPVRFHSRLYSPLIRKGLTLEDEKYKLDDTYPYIEEAKDYSYEYEIPGIMNFTKYSGKDKYKKDIKGVDINRRGWPEIEYKVYESI